MDPNTETKRCADQIVCSCQKLISWIKRSDDATHTRYFIELRSTSIDSVAFFILFFYDCIWHNYALSVADHNRAVRLGAIIAIDKPSRVMFTVAKRFGFNEEIEQVKFDTCCQIL